MNEDTTYVGGDRVRKSWWALLNGVSQEYSHSVLGGGTTTLEKLEEIRKNRKWGDKKNMKKEEIWYEDEHIKIVWNGKEVEYITKGGKEK